MSVSSGWISLFRTLEKMAALPRRIVKETSKLVQDPVPGIEAIPDEKNARYFHIKVFGPADSPYENGKLFKSRSLYIFF